MLTAIGATKVADPTEWQRLVRAAMKRAKGRIPEAAVELGVSTRTLFRWLTEDVFADITKAPASLHVQAARKAGRLRR